MAILILVVGLFLFVGLIVAHEFGHFVAARRNGVEAEEFAIFFGPTLYKRKTKAGWTFRFNLLPLGGYVKLKGEHDTDTAPGSYGAASLWAKTKIMAAGVIVNLVVGLLMLTILGLLGMPQIIPNQFSIKSNAHTISKASSLVEVDEVLSGSPAAKAGLKSGDDITAVGPKGQHLVSINSISGLQAADKKFNGQQVSIDVTRGTQHLVLTTKLNTTTEVNATASANHPKVYLGVGLGSYNSGVTLIRYSWSAPIVALGITKQVIVLTYQGLGHALHGLGGIIAGTATRNTSARKNAQTAASSEVVGPVGIFVVLKDGSAVGFQFMLFIVAIISLTLAMMNILPIPALDGGRLWITLISRLLKRPLNAHNEELVNALGMLVLFMLLGVITYVDIKRFF